MSVYTVCGLLICSQTDIIIDGVDPEIYYHFKTVKFDNHRKKCIYLTTCNLNNILHAVTIILCLCYFSLLAMFFYVTNHLKILNFNYFKRYLLGIEC